MFVFGIIFHKKTNPLLYTIEKLASSKQNIILLMLDLKASRSVLEEIKSYIEDFPNVYLIERISVDWARYSLTQATLNLIKAASRWNYKYISIISGDDIPLMNNRDMHDFLNVSYIEKYQFIGIDFQANTKRGLVNPYNRMSIKFPDVFFRKSKSYIDTLFKVFNYYYLRCFYRNNIDNLPKLYKGCNWFSITNDASNYILEFVDNSKELVDQFKDSYCSDEFFFQTILYNSPFQNNFYGNSEKINDCLKAMRYIDWVSGPEYPKVFKEVDFITLKNSNMLFARKVDSFIDINVLKKYFG